MVQNPAVYPKSPTRLKIIAFKAALVAWTLVFQKLIKRYEHKPIPSHPKNKTIKLLALTSTTIKKVNKDNKEKNLNIL
jgi:hypothetical protein